MKSSLPLAAILSCVVSLSSPWTKSAAPSIAELPGQKPDGSILLPNQWSLRPAGKQIDLADFPVNIAVHPSGRYAVVLHCGYGAHVLITVDLDLGRAVSETKINQAFYGLRFSKDGSQLYCSGAGDELIHVFSFQRGEIRDPREIHLRKAAQRGIPCGLALSDDNRELYVANLWGQSVTKIDLTSDSIVWERPFGPAASADARLAKPSDNPDLAAATKRSEAAIDPSSPDAPFPYGCVLDSKRHRLFVSLWAKAAVAVFDSGTGQLLASWPTEEHPNELVLTRSGNYLFVANASRNSVSLIDTRTGQIKETLFTSLDLSAPPGSTPNGLALSPDQRTLFVANACNNNLAVFDVQNPGASRSLGFIPVGWYPTSVRLTPDGRKLLVTNGKGILPMANPRGPQPVRRPAGTVVQYIGGLFRGTLSVIDLPSRKGLAPVMQHYTAEALQCSPPQLQSREIPAANPIPQQLGQPSPIKYCLYIIKENRTYDQVFGDIPQGRGDPDLCLFGDKVTPNHHKLVHDFVLLDNFYVESEVSADGHEWTVGAYATDFVEKTWPLNYGHNKQGKFPYPSEGHFLVAQPASGYLWDRAREAGVSYRSYGEFIDAPKRLQDPATSRVATLRGHFDPWYRPWDLDYPDVKRTERFLAELARFEKEGGMPRLQILRLPNDHTYGTSAGKLTPTSMVAENDLALGQFIAGLSRSKFWPQTAVFVVEDDAQNGPDHIDAHRTVALVISPYIRRGTIDSTLYSTSSMLRTMELILGLQPLTQFDAAARPMFNCFQEKPDLRPFDAVPAQVNLHDVNSKTAWGSGASRKMDFTKEDAADDLLLNEVIWRSVRGPHSPMPPPTRAAFVFPHPKDDDGD